MARTVTSNRQWYCPSCKAMLTKGALGVVWMPGEAIDKVQGTASCGDCGHQVSQSDVYGGKYDGPKKWWQFWK